MTFTESIQTCFVKYADFAGRASRSEFWWWTLFTLVVGIALATIDDRLNLAFTVATLLPGCAVTARRLHDTGHSGWLQLLWLVPILGWIPLIIWCAQEGKGERAAG